MKYPQGVPGDGGRVAYPRRMVARGAARLLGRLLLPIAFRLQVTGQECFPRSGPLLVVGNHDAVMEAVLMAVYTPWQVETLGAADVPHERVTELAIRFFGCIPVHRGSFDRWALNQALGVLKQGGVIALFPEGGIWEAGAKRAQTGVAWLSYRGNTPVLPIGFGGTVGALGVALRLKGPRLTMNVGESIPAASPPPGKARKVYLEEYATRVMDAVNALVPAEDRARQVRVTDEWFELQVASRGPDGVSRDIPPGVVIRHPAALAKLLHRPGVLKIFTSNLRLPTRVLQNLAEEHNAVAIAKAARSVLDYLEEENPYLLTYRFGPQEAAAMQAGLKELLTLARWAVESGLSLTIRPISRYILLGQGREIVQTEQGVFERWM